MTNFIEFFAMEGHGVFVWTALLITVFSLVMYVFYLVKAHQKLSQKITRTQRHHKTENTYDA